MPQAEHQRRLLARAASEFRWANTPVERHTLDDYAGLGWQQYRAAAGRFDRRSVAIFLMWRPDREL
jgi:hypothetical protein